MKEIIDFLRKTPAFHVATVDAENKPRVRPFSLVMEWEGKLAFCTNTTKPVYEQLSANPFIEISSFDHETGRWMRIAGKVKFTEELSAKKLVLDTMPMLRELYGDENNPILICFYIEQGEATIYSFTSESGVEKVIQFG